MMGGIIVATTTTMMMIKQSSQQSRQRRVAGGRENEMLWMVRGKSKVGGLLELAKWEGEIPRCCLCCVECGELPWSFVKIEVRSSASLGACTQLAVGTCVDPQQGRARPGPGLGRYRVALKYR